MSIQKTTLQIWKERITYKKTIIKNLSGFLLSQKKTDLKESGIILALNNRLLNCVAIKNSLYQCSKDKNHLFLTSKYRCKSRGCPICDPIYSLKLQEKFTIPLNKASDLRFITFTIPNTKTINRVIIKKLLNAFTQSYKNLKKELELVGAISKLEISYNSDPKSKSFGTWHPHLHCILSTERSQTPNSKIEVLFRREWQNHFLEAEQIRCITANESSKKEVLKYSLKPSVDIPYAEYFIAISKLRLLRTYGCFRNINLTDDSQEHILIESESESESLKIPYLGLTNHVPYISEIPIKKRNIFTTTDILQRDCPCCIGILELYTTIPNSSLKVKIIPDFFEEKIEQ